MTRTASTHQARLAVRKCRVCEWQGEVIERPGEVGDCPWCHGPTDLVNVVPPLQVSGEKNPHAAALGRMGGAKGGQARAAALTAKKRSAIAMKAAKARWSKKRPKR